MSFEPGLVIVSSVRITNRQDCCQERLSDFEIRIGDYFGREAEKSPRCGGLHTIRGDSKVIQCPNMVGRFLTIRIPGKKKILTLCEVEVYGSSKYYVVHRSSEMPQRKKCSYHSFIQYLYLIQTVVRKKGTIYKNLHQK